MAKSFSQRRNQVIAGEHNNRRLERRELGCGRMGGGGGRHKEGNRFVLSPSLSLPTPSLFALSNLDPSLGEYNY